MTKNEVQYYWNYFCSLCDRLQRTTQYVDHSVGETGKMRNGDVNSFEFQQIITLAAMEFENICKMICVEIDPEFSLANADIREITGTILGKYPKIIETEVWTDYQLLTPLKDWKVVTNSERSKVGRKKNQKVVGLIWWKAYNNLKHQSFNNFNKATLMNAVDAVASLMVVELYFVQIMKGNLNIPLNTPCKYFGCCYVGDVLCDSGELLPDWKKNHKENE